MDGTVGGGDSPRGGHAPPSLPLSEPLSVSSMSPLPAPEPVPVPVHARSIETLNDAMRGTSICVEAPRSKRALDSYAEYYAEARRTSLEARKRLIDKLRKGDLPIFPQLHAPRKRARRREAPDKLYPLFQCDRGHYICMQCYEHHSKKCRYCGTTKGSVVNWNKENAKEYTNRYSCHKGRGWVTPKEDDVFCPDSSCQFCGPLDSVLNHVTDVHSMTIQHFSYGEVIRIPLHLVGNYLILSAEDGTTFVLWIDDTRRGKMLSVVCAEQPSFCRTRFSLELAYDLPPVVRSWLRGDRWTPLYYSSNPKVKPWDCVGSSIVKYEKNHDVSGIAHAKSKIISSHIWSSNLGDMCTDTKHYCLSVPPTFRDSGKWYGDLILSISSLSDTTKSPANV